MTDTGNDLSKTGPKRFRSFIGAGRALGWAGDDRAWRLNGASRARSLTWAISAKSMGGVGRARILSDAHTFRGWSQLWGKSHH